MSAAKALSSEPIPQAAPESRPPDPSMDDILASIRRIIADDQSRHAGVVPTSPRPPAAPVARPSLSPSTMSPPGAPPQGAAPAGMTRVPPPAAPVPPVLRDGPLPRPPVMPPQSRATNAPSLAPSLSVPRPLMERGPVPGDRAAVRPHLNPPALPDPGVQNDFLIDEIANAGRVSALQSAASETLKTPSAIVPTPANAAPEIDLEPSGLAPTHLAAVDAPVVAVPDASVSVIEAVAAPMSPVSVLELEPAAPAASQASEPAPDASISPEALVSSEAGATIETSFHALATSVFLQNSGMVESLMRDMLRPMLKSWLDDNLPAIVERLVRVEIERVARGGRA